MNRPRTINAPLDQSRVRAALEGKFDENPFWCLHCDKQMFINVPAARKEEMVVALAETGVFDVFTSHANRPADCVSAEKAPLPFRIVITIDDSYNITVERPVAVSGKDMNELGAAMRAAEKTARASAEAIRALQARQRALLVNNLRMRQADAEAIADADLTAIVERKIAEKLAELAAQQQAQPPPPPPPPPQPPARAPRPPFPQGFLSAFGAYMNTKPGQTAAAWDAWKRAFAAWWHNRPPPSGGATP